MLPMVRLAVVSAIVMPLLKNTKLPSVTASFLNEATVVAVLDPAGTVHNLICDPICTGLKFCVASIVSPEKALVWKSVPSNPRDNILPRYCP